MALKVYTGHGGIPFVCDDTRGFGDALAQISVRAQAPINSCAREQAAEPLLEQIGKMSQRELFNCAQARLRTGACPGSCNGNCNPANPPGFSTHERRNDGVAYKRALRGARLRYWQRGVDVLISRVSVFIAEAAKEGWLVTQTYPSSVNEAQHVNFRRQPRISLWEFRPLTGGETGRRAREVIRLLHKIQEPGKRVPYLAGETPTRYGERVQNAIRRFQEHHHVEPDGEVGLRTITLLRGTARRPPSRFDQAGIDFLVAHEGEVLNVYNDPAGHATFGVGHLLHRGNFTAEDARRFGTRDHPKDPVAMRRLSRELLDVDAARFEKAVLQHVPVRWRDSHDRFNAFGSMALNLGEEILTPQAPLQSVGQALQGRDVGRLVAAVLLFDKAGSPPRAMPGLTRRRHDEADLIRRNR